MKATNLAIWSLVALFAAGFTSCKKDDIKITEPHMTLTTTKNMGEIISLWIYADNEDRSDLWIDLNNNGIQDSGEAVTKFDGHKNYTLGAQTITIYGKVKTLHCNETKLKALDVSKNSALIVLKCQDNKISTLNLSNNTELTQLWCHRNQITTLDVSKSTKLIDLRCDDNQITSLNVSNNPKLEDLWCHSNQLSTLDVSKNTVLEMLLCNNNSIYGSNMTALVNSLPTCNAGNEGNFYVVNRDGDGNVCTPAQVYIAKNKNWNVMDSEGAIYSGSK